MCDIPRRRQACPPAQARRRRQQPGSPRMRSPSKSPMVQACSCGNRAPNKTARKYAIISCLLALSTSKRSRKLVISHTHGTIGYLKKLSEKDMAGVKMMRSLLCRKYHDDLQLKQVAAKRSFFLR